MSDLEKAKAVVAKIQQRASDTLHPLSREMKIMKWAPEYQIIMWKAVAEEAMRRAVISSKSPK